MAKMKAQKAIKEGGFEQAATLYDNSNKRQHHEVPIGHGEALSKAQNYGSYGDSDSPGAGQHSNKGSSEALSQAKSIGGSMGSETGADRQTYEREGAGEMAYAKSKGPKDEGRGVKKESGYRLNKGK